MPESYSLHIAGDDKSHPPNRTAFLNAACRLCALSHSRGFTSQLLDPDVDVISKAAAAVADEMNQHKSGTFLLTYTGHGDNNKLCGKKGAVWMLQRDVSYHEESLKRLLIARFDPAIKVVVMSDSCYSEDVGSEKRLWRLLHAYIRRLRASKTLSYEEIAGVDGFQTFAEWMRLNDDICDATMHAPKLNREWLHLSAGEGLVVPALLTRETCNILGNSAHGNYTYAQLKAMVLNVIPGFDIQGPKPLQNDTAFKP